MFRAKSVDDYIAYHTQHEKGLKKLREILLGFPLEETLKWGAPTYMYSGKNLIGIGSFKSYMGLWFFQGGLLVDDHKVLINAQEGKTKAMRQWRFDSFESINQPLVEQYIHESIEHAKAGREIKRNTRKPLLIPTELEFEFKQDKAFKTAFEALTHGKKREYADYISEAKQDATKRKRMDKIKPMVMKGIGLNDAYR